MQLILLNFEYPSLISYGNQQPFLRPIHFFFLQLGISDQPDSSSEVSLSQMMFTFRNSKLDEDNLTLVFNSVY